MLDTLKRFRPALFALPLAGAGIGICFFLFAPGQKGLTLYGNVDQRQIQLAFADPERIAEVLVQEGMRVQPGQVLARLETRRLRDGIAIAEAQAASTQAMLDKLKNGTRPEEIAQAKAAVTSAEAELTFAVTKHQRNLALASDSKGRAVSKLDVDESQLRLNIARARLSQEQKGLRLAEIGPRREDIAQAEAAVLENIRNIERLRNQLQDAELISPAHSVVRRRLMEAGDMASPQKPVFSLAVLSPKWIRAYVSGNDLGHVRCGMNALVRTDSHPDEDIPGTVGFISPVAEFTPKAVQTPELRTSLVYETRIHVEDRNDRLRLGMPVTVSLPDAAR
jgi:HlyD family secretion protein